MAIPASNRQLRAMALMALSSLCGVAMAATVRHLSGELHPFVIAFWRNLLGAATLLPWLPRYGFVGLRTRRFGAHLLRSAICTVSMVLAFTAVSMIPLAEYTSIDFLSPVFGTLFGILVFGEKGHWYRWAALAIGFAGMLAITRPGFAEINAGVFYILAAAAMWGIALPMIHHLGRTESAFATTMWAAILMAGLALVPAIFVWSWPSLAACLWLAFLGVIGSVAQVALSKALIIAETGAVAPADFLKLVFAAILGFILFGEVPAIWTWLGGSLIVLAGLLLVNGERLSRHRPSAAGPTPPP
jgi:drug/metabolite transporter (DMT)-like permease